MLTRGEQRRRSSVDYMFCALVYDNSETMEHILAEEVTDFALHAECT